MREGSLTDGLLAFVLMVIAVGCNAFADADAIRASAEREREQEAPACNALETRCSGVCVLTREDPAHCGGCDQACSPGPNSSASCFESRCVFTCDEGTEDRNADLGLGDRGNGCECTPQNPCDPIDEGVCGNGACESDESRETCCRDCPCEEGHSCTEGTCVPLEDTCGNDICDEADGQCCQDCGCTDDLICNEDTGLCEAPGQCGDGTCQPDEDTASCCQDCGCNADHEVCEPGEGCSLGQWDFVTIGHISEVGFYTTRGKWHFAPSGSYQVATQESSVPLALLGPGQLLLDAEGGIFGVEGANELHGQIDAETSLMALSSSPQPGLVVLTRRTAAEAPLTPQGSYRLSGLTMGDDLGGIAAGLQTVEGLMTFDEEGCLNVPGSRISLGDTALVLNPGGCVETGPQGQLKVPFPNADNFQIKLQGFSPARGPIVLSRQRTDTAGVAVGIFILTPVADRAQALEAEGTYHTNGFQSSQGFVESRWGTVRCLDADLRDGAFETSEGNTPELRRGDCALLSDGGFEADLFLVGGRREVELYTGQAFAPNAGDTATTIISHGQAPEFEDDPRALLLWLKR